MRRSGCDLEVFLKLLTFGNELWMEVVEIVNVEVDGGMSCSIGKLPDAFNSRSPFPHEDLEMLTE
jgi:hypothetical protein